MGKVWKRRAWIIKKKSGKYKKKDEIKSTLSLNKLSILVQSCCKSSTPETEEDVQWTTGYPELYNKTMLTFFFKKKKAERKSKHWKWTQIKFGTGVSMRQKSNINTRKDLLAIGSKLEFPVKFLLCWKVSDVRVCGGEYWFLD